MKKEEKVNAVKELTEEELEQVTGGTIDPKLAKRMVSASGVMMPFGIEHKWKQTEFDGLTSFAYNLGNIDN